MAFAAVLSSVGVELQAWFRRAGVSPPDLAELFPQEELDSGEAVLELEAELGIADDDSERFRRDFFVLIEAAAGAARRETQRLATVPIWRMHLEQQAKRLKCWRESELQGYDNQDDARLRQVPPPPPARPRFGTSRRRGVDLVGDERGREKAEADDRNKWLQRLMAILAGLDAASLRATRCRDSQRLVGALVGGRRASTLRARVRAWEKYQGWLRDARGVSQPTCTGDLIDYLLDRAAEPCGRSVIRSTFDMMRFAEEMTGVPQSERFTESGILKGVVKGLLSESPSSGPGRRGGQAPRPFVKMVALLEQLILDDGADLYRRLLAWWMVFSVWGVMRFDDHRGLIIADVQETDIGWTFMLVRSKTTGPDKTVLARPGVVARGAYIRESGWCQRGLELWAKAAPGRRDYALCVPSPEGGCVLKELGYCEYTGRMRGIIASLSESGGQPLGSDVASFVTPHSFRAFLPSLAAAVGAPPEWLGWLSAWKAKGAEVYVRTSRQRTVVLQATAARIARDFIDGGDPFGEHELLDDLDRHMAERGVAQEERNRAREVLTSYPWPPVTELLWDAGKDQDKADDGNRAGRGTASASDDLSQKGGSEPQAMEPELPEVPKIGTGYVVSVSGKRKLRRLHRWGWCHRVPGVDYRQFVEYGDRCPEPQFYDDYCHQCWRGDDRPTAGIDAEEDQSVATEDESSSTDGSS